MYYCVVIRVFKFCLKVFIADCDLLAVKRSKSYIFGAFVMYELLYGQKVAETNSHSFIGSMKKVAANAIFAGPGNGKHN